MKKQGYAEATIKGRVKLLRTMCKRGAHLNDSESIKDVIARQKTWSNTRKNLAVIAYDCYLKMKGKTWDPPRYKLVNKLPFIPTEDEIDQLIAGCNTKTAAFLQLLKETGMRSGEAWQLHWTHIDPKRKAVRVIREKHSNPRELPISDNAIAMLNLLPKQSEKIFGDYLLPHFSRNYRKQRLRISHKLQNPRLLSITFHTFRHWKATMEYHRTKDILYIKQLLGHKNINSTLVYTHLVQFEHEDNFTCRVANTID
jgi:integrase